MAKRSQSARSAVSPQDKFIDAYTDFALDVAEVTGMAPEVVLGQAALESGWGKSVAGNNMFGIKGAGQSVVTHEDIPGVGMTKVTDSFRAYSNPLDSFMDYGDLMGNSRYGHIGKNQTVDQQIASIGKSGYATDRNYGRKLGGVVDIIQANKTFQNKVVGNATASIPVADAFLGDIGVPVNRIDVSSIPDLTPAREAGFSLEGWQPDFGTYSPIGPAGFAGYSGITPYSDVSSGLLSPGNIDLDNRPMVENPDGTISTVRSMSINVDGVEALVPTVSDDGRLLSDEEAIDQFRATGQHLGLFDTPEAATAYAEQLHKAQEAQYLGDPWADFSSITAGTAFDPLTSISPSAPAAPNFSDVELGTYPDITADMYSSPMESFAPVDTAPVNLSDVPTGPQPSGFSAGLGEGPWGATPDFSAPSLEARNAMDRFNGAMQVRNTTAPDLTNEAIAQSLMNEIAPQTPAMAPAPVASVTQAPSVSSTAPMGDIPDEFGPNFPSATPQSAPQAVTRAAPQSAPVSLPSAPAPSPTRTQQQVAKDFDLPSFDLGLPSLPSPSLRGIGSTLGLMDPIEKTSFMDAMANPQIAQGWSPGFLDTRLGKATTGAAMGFLTGGPFGAVTNGLYSGLDIGGMFSNAFDRYANAYSNLTPDDFAAFGLDGNWTDREPTRNTGRESGARVGDGSYSEFSGYNDNNPQGIL
ncbi:glycoside hydrolase family 73 protein [Microvirga lotononidis]|uniref:Muramidase (Flagellum-specific) n=1 Tax=Microvirga lotononidis TaxID=864069 RepID=I4YP68_9HYPH|nr:glucosaminidase domain-containing protein [Microvirga lotononidis]EIM25760.1 muramidase (flagellum-specific) [Microvirga lotononidis]WQO25687.1 glucosaminidase domain-containing protein [Microvirga lotononidis]